MKKLVFLLTNVYLLYSCGNNDHQELSHTGDQDYEVQVSSLTTIKEVEVGKEYFITASRLRVRSADSYSPETILGVLGTNDKIRVLDNSADLLDDFVEVEIVKTKSSIQDSPSGRYYLSFKYFDEVKKVTQQSFKYFVVQNIATERLRVYKRNTETNSHKMILETEIVVGDEKKSKSILGVFKITEWHKFYRDGARHYPSWYDPSLPMPPGPNSDALDWFDKDYMPRGGDMRGAFGWYTAKIGPNAHYQWTHGTIGYGKQSYEFIEKTKGFWANLVANPRSSGCSRTNNEVIAYLRHILPAGTPIIKIYAKERYSDVSYADMPEKYNQWDYILTKDGVRQVNGSTADANTVRSKGYSARDVLDQGTFMIDTKPTTFEFRGYRDPAKCRAYIQNYKDEMKAKGKKLQRRNGALRIPPPTRRDGGERICDVVKNKKANVYDLKDSRFNGYYFVDKGIVSSDYAHPKRDLIVGGYRDVTVPSYMQSK